MSKSRKQREQEKQRPPKKPQPERSRWFRIAKRIFESTLAGCTLIGVIVLWPRVTIDNNGQMDPSHPYPISFKITNTGFVPLRDVQPFVGLCEISSGEPKSLPDRCGNGSLGPKFALSEWHVRWLARDEPTTIRLDDIFPIKPTDKFGAADISIGVEFGIWIIPWLRVPIEYRFQTRPEPDGKLSWVPRPLDK